MKRLGTLLTLVVLSGTLFTPKFASSQTATFPQLKFTFQHSLRIPDNYVSVVFTNGLDSVDVHVQSLPKEASEAKWAASKKEYSFRIGKAEYAQIIRSVQRIDQWAITAAADFKGFDGTSWKIEFGDMRKPVIYNVWSADFQTQARHLQPFVDACKFILQVSKLDPQVIFAHKH